mmetsp:Transcript_23456/g.39787  ORF Transcript_23456/g.39787 Transcript_23456/m.39787 type:complete len:544 (-) Transcript_23456:224-1855(-)
MTGILGVPQAETMDAIIASGSKVAIQEAIVSNFVSLLGSSSGSGAADVGGTAPTQSSASLGDFLACLSDAVSDSDVVCTLPTLEMPQGKKGEEYPLPRVGETAQRGDGLPKMAASVLNSTVEASPDASKIEQATAQHMSTLTSWTKSTLIYAPQAASNNVSASLTNLVQSRVRAWTLLLLRHSLTRGDPVSRACLLSMLSAKIEMKSVVTTLRTLPLPQSAYVQEKEADVVLPLLFEAALVISVQGREDNVALRAPGTVAGHFSKSGSPGLTKVEVRIDTTALLESMVEQARLVVFKAVARATGGVQSPESKPKRHVVDNSNPSRLAGFSSALNLSADAAAKSPRLQKARSSALRLNSILQGKSEAASTPLSKTRKTRSVQWESPFDLPSKDTSNFPTAKRQRHVQSQARLRSMKSFGRPHAEHGHNPNNATFNDFGGRGGPTWGRDGKLRNHPVPGGGGMSSRLSSLTAGANQPSRQNATFDFTGGAPRTSRLTPSLSSSLNFSKRPGGRKVGGNMGGIPSTLPRTATALESWLVKKSQGHH